MLRRITILQIFNWFIYIPEPIKSYLERLQIFESLNNGKIMIKELNDCCFIYVLKQTGKFSEDELNLMRLRIITHYLSKGNIKVGRWWKVDVRWVLR